MESASQVFSSGLNSSETAKQYGGPMVGCFFVFLKQIHFILFYGWLLGNPTMVR